MMNKRFNFLTLVVLLSSVCFTFSVSFANGDSEPEPAETMVKEDILLPNPQREYCIITWNKYYSDHNININVSTRGVHDEIVVFKCPDCSLEKHYVEPFLNTETNGMTSAERVKACGFVKAVFKGVKGLREIERDI